MKGPSALSSINVKKYFPQPKSIRIKVGGGGGWLDRGRRKNQLVESFAKKGVGVEEVGLGREERPVRAG